MTGPLSGKTVLVTRSRERAEELAALLRDRGAVPLVAPAIRLEPVPPGGRLDEAIRSAAAGAYEWVVFTSATGVRAWFDRAGQGGSPRARIAAVGDGTAGALDERGVRPSFVPSVFTTAALGAEFPSGSGTVLLARADIATRELEEALAGKGWTPIRVDAYRSLPADALPAEAAEALSRGRVDALTFTSRSTVEGFVALAGPVRGPAVVCIGPVTAHAAHEAGLAVTAVASPHTLEGLVAAVERALPAR